MGRILFGYYAVPDSSSVPIDFVINLEGNEERSKKRCAASSSSGCMLFCALSLQQSIHTWAVIEQV